MLSNRLLFDVFIFCVDMDCLFQNVFETIRQNKYDSEPKIRMTAEQFCLLYFNNLLQYYYVIFFIFPIYFAKMFN